MNQITEIFPELSIPKKIVITMHQNPDPDAMGSSLGLYHLLIQLGHNVIVISPTKWPDFLNWMPGCDLVLNYENDSHKEHAEKSIMAVDWIFCLDFNAIYRTKNLENVIREATCKRILIDHHQQPEVASFHYGISNTTKSSTSEMVYDLVVASGHEDKINIPMMECLYAGLVGDTGSFRHSSTSISVHNMVAHMKSKGLNHTPVHDNLNTLSQNRLKFLGHVLCERIFLLKEYNTALISISKDDLLKFNVNSEDTGELVYYLLRIKDIKLAAICIQVDEEIRWSFRSNGNFDVNMFARNHFKGGGHCNAAGGKSSGSQKKAIEKFIAAVKENAEQLK